LFEHLRTTVDPKTAIAFYSKRYSYRICRRVAKEKKAVKAGKGK
jgi:hypothetical protein